MTNHMHNGIWILVETVDGMPTGHSLELLTPARRFADRMHHTVTAVLTAGAAEDTAQAERALGQAGADKVLVVRHDLLARYQSELFTDALAELIRERRPSAVFAPATSTGRDYVPRLAVRTGAGIVSNVTELELDEQMNLFATQPCFAEAALARVEIPEAHPRVYLIRGRVFDAPAADAGRSAEVETVTPNLSADRAHTKLLESIQPEVKGARKLEAAEVIVSGGRGLKGPENFHLIEELAAQLGAAVGASRAVVDAGWRPHAEQVGQTGKTVTPKLYFAVGISGAIQHQVGMSNSKMIIAINRDADAPIFKLADFGIVGDALEILPELTRALKEQNLALSV